MRVLITLIATLAFPGVLRAAEPDLSTPKAPLLALANALEAGDGAAVRAVCVAGQDETQFLATMADAWAAQQRFSQAVTAKWGEAGKFDESWGIKLQFETMVPLAHAMRAQIDHGEVAIQGDDAVWITTDQPEKGLSQSRMIFHKIDGQWRLDLKQSWSAPEGLFLIMTSPYRDMIDLLNGMLADIGTGKFATADEARQAMKSKAAELGRLAMNRVHEQAATRRAATQPVSNE